MKTIRINIKYFIKNLWFVYLAFKSKPKSFVGYGKYWLARKYADKRTSTMSGDGVTGRKRHYVFPYSDNILFVCNRTEINGMVKSKMISKKVNIKYMIENAYYISK